MPSDLKLYLKNEISRDISDLRDMLFIDASRLPAQKAGELRGRLEEAGITMKVIRNRLARRAFEEAGLAVPEQAFMGPTAVVFGGESASAISRVLTEWNKKEAKVDLKGGLLEGAAGNAEEAVAWAGLPSRTELLASILGGILAPASGLGGAFAATIGQFANLLAAHIEKMEKD
jgi:large subunit ribosomal protein L10